MRRTYLLAIFAVGVMLVAGSYAAFASGGLSGAAASLGSGVQPADVHVGDQLRYERAWSEEDVDGNLVDRRTDLVVTVEGAGRASERHGRVVEVESVRVDVAEQDELLTSQRCSALAGSTALVRRDVLAGELGILWTYAQENVFDAVTSSESSARYDARALFHGDCLSRSALAGVDLRSGDILPLAEAASGTGTLFEGVAEFSLPATRTDMHGRAALTFRFPSTDPEAREGAGFTVTFADGLPGVVEAVWTGVGGARIEHDWIDTDVAPLTLALVGHAPADGARVGAMTGATLEDAPAADLAPLAPLAFDDRAFSFPYTYAEAFDALVADPTLCVSDFLAEHPDAALAWARYDASERDPFLFDMPTDGGWVLRFQSGTDACAAMTIRLATPVPGLGATRNYPEDFPVLEEGGEAEPMPPLPDTLVSPEATARLLAAEGVDVADVKWLRYGPAEGSLDVGTMPFFGPDEEGRAKGVLVYLDADEAALHTVADGEGERVEELTVKPLGAPWGFPDNERSLAALLAGPYAGQGLAVGVIAGVALLALLAKSVLLPLYTRLTRDALLENPTRSRLYEQVRRDPGIHQAELVDFAGIGKGATARHLDRLVKARFLAEIHEDGLTRYYAVGEIPPAVAQRAAILRSDSLRAVYELYREHPDMPLREASRRLGVSAPSVHRSKKKLEAAGLLPAAKGAVVSAA